MEYRKYQHKIWIQYHLGSGDVILSYSYPDPTNHKIPEQRLKYDLYTMDQGLKENLIIFHQFIENRIPEPEIVRLPHAELKPEITCAFLSIAVLDQDRAENIPMSRLYYYEEIKAIPSKVEREIRLEKPEMSEDELSMAKAIGSELRKIVWQDYQGRFKEGFRDK